MPGRQALQSALLRVQALEAEVATLRPEVIAASSGLRELQQQYDLLVEVNAKNQRTVDHQDLQLQHLRRRLRKAGGRRDTIDKVPEFADREQGFRHSVVTAWATRTPVGEQADHPLPDYTLGPDFLESLAALEGVSPSKVADVVVEVLTGRAKDLDGRDLHRLRESEAGGSPYRQRAGDGATAWRVALQRNAPGARRLHFWRLRDDTIESLASDTTTTCGCSARAINRGSDPEPPGDLVAADPPDHRPGPRRPRARRSRGTSRRTAARAPGRGARPR